jgi:hypothetical protein
VNEAITASDSTAAIVFDRFCANSQYQSEYQDLNEYSLEQIQSHKHLLVKNLFELDVMLNEYVQYLFYLFDRETELYKVRIVTRCNRYWNNKSNFCTILNEIEFRIAYTCLLMQCFV